MVGLIVVPSEIRESPVGDDGVEVRTAVSVGERVSTALAIWVRGTARKMIAIAKKGVSLI
jgi:hypothetical protein